MKMLRWSLKTGYLLLSFLLSICCFQIINIINTERYLEIFMFMFLFVVICYVRYIDQSGSRKYVVCVIVVVFVKVTVSVIYLKLQHFRFVGFENTRDQMCTRTLCDLNRDREEVIIKTSPDNQCKIVHECVTGIVTTSRRLINIMALVRSLRHFHPQMNIIVTDETHQVSEEFQRFLVQDKYLSYIRGTKGISNGRNVALDKVKTKYFLLMDDDFIFTQTANISKLVNLLDHSDLSIVGGKCEDIDFEGAIRIRTDNKNRTFFTIYPKVAYAVIPEYPNCVQVDTVKNIFLARTNAVQKAGAWSEMLPLMEHEDFFAKMRKSRLKIAFCADFEIVHNSTEGLSKRSERLKLVKKYRTILSNIWHIDHPLQICSHLAYPYQYHCFNML